MKVKATVDGLEVDGQKHKKGDEFVMTNSRAAYDAAERGEVKILADQEPEGANIATPAKKPK